MAKAKHVICTPNSRECTNVKLLMNGCTGTKHMSVTSKPHTVGAHTVELATTDVNTIAFSLLDSNLKTILHYERLKYT
jgi:hypothetical protein